MSVSSAATSTDPFFQNFADLPVTGPSHLVVDLLNVDACDVEGFSDAFDESYTEFVGTEGDEEMTQPGKAITGAEEDAAVAGLGTADKAVTGNAAW